MKNLFLFVIALVTFISCDQDESYFVNEINTTSFIRIDRPSDCDFTAPIHDNISSTTELINKLKACYTPAQSYSYSQARTFLYTNVDVTDGKVKTIYTNTETELNPGPAQSTIDAAFKAGINCEHAFPQSKGANNVPARSDMYHIYPALDYVNSMRLNYPYANIDNNAGVTWYKGKEVATSQPSDEENWSKGKTGAFEPMDSKKGDIARSIFYFVTIYNDVADQNYFNGMRSTLIEWHKADPVSAEELARAAKIEQLQNNKNPYIIDPSLVERVFQP